MVTLTFTGNFSEIIEGAELLGNDYGFSVGGGGISVTVEKAEGGTLAARLSRGVGYIRYSRKCHFFRALGLFLEALGDGRGDFDIEETPRFDMNGPMFDISQGNALINVENIKKTLRQMAIMGLNMFMLYNEDNYEVKSQPYFGYMRPKYTEDDMRECDEYADTLGIEIIPCIQTLAHLAEVLKWPTYAPIKEDTTTLLVGADKTYEFIRDIVAAAVKPFKTKRIHIGMDEAWHLGHGQYFKLNGLVDATLIMRQHLERVIEIIREMGLEPMMWGDMFFRALAPDGVQYYNRGLVIPPKTKKSVPEGVSLIYWDYYHHTDADYEDFIGQHRVLGEPIFAGAVWTWIGFAPHWDMTFDSSEHALNTCKRMGVREVFVTIWGDNGTEAPYRVNMPGILYYAEHGYCDEPDMERLKKRFAFCCGADLDDFLALELLDKIPGSAEKFLSYSNPSKHLMWQDVMTGLYDLPVRGKGLAAHYAGLAARFAEAEAKGGYYASMFGFYSQVAHVLELKSEVGIALTDAYGAGDRVKMAEIAGVTLPEVAARVRKLRELHRELWFDCYKTMGWDIFDLRYGGLLTRIDTAVFQIRQYLDGTAARLDELEEVRLHPHSTGANYVPGVNYYERICSASRIATYGYGV